MTLAEGIGLAVSLLLAVAGAFWVMLKIIVGQFKETVDKRLEALETRVGSSSEAVIAEKVRALESDYELLHQFKNTVLPARLDRLYENAISHSDHRDTETSRRLDLLERKVLNGSAK